MERLFILARNKYLVSGVAFFVWMCFFDRYDLATQYSYQQEKSKLEKEKDFYTKEVSNIEKAIADTRSNPSEIERVAREKYKMKRDNEDIYVITEPEVAQD